MLNASDFVKPPNAPYIPSGINGNYTRIETQINVEGIQIMYGTVMATIPAIAIIWTFLRKKGQIPKIYGIMTK